MDINKSELDNQYYGKVSEIYSENGELGFYCPHCGEYCGVSEDFPSEMKGEMYEHLRCCGGHAEIDSNARLIKC